MSETYVDWSFGEDGGEIKNKVPTEIWIVALYQNQP